MGKNAEVIGMLVNTNIDGENVWTIDSTMFHGIEVESDDGVGLIRNIGENPAIIQPVIDQYCSSNAIHLFDGFPGVTWQRVPILKEVYYPHKRGDGTFYESAFYMADPDLNNPNAFLESLPPTRSRLGVEYFLLRGHRIYPPQSRTPTPPLPGPQAKVEANNVGNRFIVELPIDKEVLSRHAMLHTYYGTIYRLDLFHLLASAFDNHYFTCSPVHI